MCEKKEIIINQLRNLEKRKNKLIEILKKLKDELMVDDWYVNSNICFILSCPGYYELFNDKVCSGNTGDNLDKVIKHLLDLINKDRQLEKIILDNKNEKIRYQSNIINSSNKVHFMELTSDTEPEEKEINTTIESRKITESIKKKDINYYVLCGEKAIYFFEQIENSIKDKKYKKAVIGHLSYQSVNYLIPNSKLNGCKNSKDRANKRCEMIADDIFNQFKGKESELFKK